MIQIFVGSTNKVKVNAVKQACQGSPVTADVKGFSVESGVSAQPMSDAETRRGATFRARAALAAGLSQQPQIQGALGIGLEGGVFEHEDGTLWSTVWVVVVDQSGNLWESNGARFPVPQVVANKIKAGGEMGPVVTAMTGMPSVKEEQGMIGIITRDFTNRTEEYSSIARLALGLWYGREWAAHFKD